jgi:adenosine deaminase
MQRLAAVAAGFADRWLVGFDLAGPEAAFPNPLAHRRAFDVARDAGLRITVHAGEWGGAAQVRRALDVCPERIAHGRAPSRTGAVRRADPNAGSRSTCDPTSNVQAGIVPTRADHPLAVLPSRGVAVTLSTDDRTVSDITLTDEYIAAVEEIRPNPSRVVAIDRRALDVAFAAATELVPLKAEFDAWAVDNTGDS